MSALLEQVLNLKKRADLKILNNPQDTKAFNAAMKAANALLGAQGHHLFDQQELIRAFAGRSPEFYFRVIKKLGKKGIVVNDNAKQIIPAWGDQTKGTVHSKIHEQVRGRPKVDYSQLSERQLIQQLTKEALARKRIAASTITSTIEGLKKADPTFNALPAKYIARWIKENPKEFHKLTKDIPVPIPTDKRWPIGKGGAGTISIEGAKNADLRRILGIGKGAGTNAQYLDGATGAAVVSGLGNKLANTITNPVSANATGNMLQEGVNKKNLTQFGTGIAGDLVSKLLMGATAKIPGAALLGPAAGAAAVPLAGAGAAYTMDQFLKGYVNGGFKELGQISEKNKDLHIKNGENGHTLRRKYRHGKANGVNGDENIERIRGELEEQTKHNGYLEERKRYLQNQFAHDEDVVAALN